jgi:hypothetical protein
VSAFDRLDDSWQGSASRAWADALLESASALRRQGVDPSIRDADVPFAVVAGVAPPFNRLSTVVPTLDSSLAVGRGGSAPAVVGEDGTIRIADSAPVWGGGLVTLASFGSIDGATALTWRSNALCSAADAAAPLAVHVDGAPSDRELWLGVAVVPQPAARPIPLSLDRGSGFPPPPDLSLPVPAGGRLAGAFVDRGPVSGIRLDLPRGTCIRALELVAVS